MDAGADDGAAGRHGRERRGDERAGRGEDDRGVELLGRRLVRAARPRGPELPRERLRLPRRPARVKAKTRRPCVAGDLRDDVRRGAEAVEPEPLGVAREAQRAVADQARAEERRRLEIRVPVGEREAVALVRDGQLGVAAVERGSR